MSISRVVNALLPHPAVDSVAVFDTNFNQLFPRARPLKVTVSEIAKVMEHPVENGTVITDHRVIMPIEIEMSMLLNSVDYPDVYRVIKQFYLDGTLVIVQTKTGVYKNQLIASIPHEESPEQYTAVPMALKFKQAMFVSESVSTVPKNPNNNATLDRGIQNTSAANATQTAAASSSFNSQNNNYSLPTNAVPPT